ncbi:unnamed protein product [Gongylonema pulchrum]|uniref:Uncharacterized protein n=1 Tax=Gongylonema pulchrum TaxID=637853 RepID=A0A183E9R2_9BILA|nr:unnamed protein product [Gongylonema pulchrum]
MKFPLDKDVAYYFSSAFAVRESFTEEQSRMSFLSIVCLMWIQRLLFGTVQLDHFAQIRLLTTKKYWLRFFLILNDDLC